MELSSLKIRKFLIFQEMESPKKTSYISGGDIPSSEIIKTTLKKILFLFSFFSIIYLFSKKEFNEIKLNKANKTLRNNVAYCLL